MHFAADLVAWDLQVGQMGNTHEHHGLCEDEHVDERSGGSIVSAPEERVGFALWMVGFVITPSNTPAGGGGEG